MELKKFDIFSALIPAGTVPKRKAGKIVQRGTYMTTTEYAKHKILPVSTVRQMYKKSILIGFNTGNVSRNCGCYGNKGVFYANP